MLREVLRARKLFQQKPLNIKEFPDIFYTEKKEELLIFICSLLVKEGIKNKWYIIVRRKQDGETGIGNYGSRYGKPLWRT